MATGWVLGTVKAVLSGDSLLIMGKSAPVRAFAASRICDLARGALWPVSDPFASLNLRALRD